MWGKKPDFMDQMCVYSWMPANLVVQIYNVLESSGGNIYYAMTSFILLKARVTSINFLKCSLFPNAYCQHPDAALGSDSRGGATDRP